MTLPNDTNPFELDEQTRAQLEALDVEAQDAYDFFYATEYEVHNPSRVISSQSGLESYGLPEAFETFLPEATQEQRDAQLATYALGRYIKYQIEDIPRQERYVRRVDDNRRELGGLFEGLDERAQDVLFSRLDGDYSVLLKSNLDKLAQGEAISANSAYTHAVPNPETDPAGFGSFGRSTDSFADAETYLNFELDQLRQNFPQLENSLDVQGLTRYVNLDEEQQFLSSTTPDNFEVFSTVGEARLQNLFETINAPARETANLITEGGSYKIRQGLSDDGEEDIFERYDRIISTADPRYSNYNQYVRDNPILRGRTRVGSAGELEVFGVDNQTIAELAFDPLNLVPVPVVDDLVRFGFKVPATVSQYTVRGGAGLARRVVVPATRSAIDVGSSVSRQISAASASALGRVQRSIRGGGSVTDATPDISPLINTPDNADGLQVIFRDLNNEYGTGLSNRLLAPEGKIDANLTQTDRRLIQSAFDYGSPSEATQSTALKSALPTLTDTDFRTLQNAFEGTPKRWQDEAGDGFARWNAGQPTDPEAAAVFTKIQNTYVELNTYVRQRGYGTSNELFSRIRSGDAYLANGDTAASNVARGNAADVVDVNSSTPVRSRYELREQADLVSANDTIGNVYPRNPDYPTSLRGRSVDPDLVQAISRDLNPELIATPTDSIRGGTPVITRDGVVIDGNQVVSALRTPGTDLDGYRTYVGRNLNRFGISRSALKDFDNPVLVRTVVDPNDYARAGRLAETNQLNEITSAGEIGDIVKSFKFEDQVGRGIELSQARELAEAGGRIPNNSGLIGLLRAPSNDALVTRLAKELIPEGKRASLLNTAGGLNPDGIQYLKGVLEASIADPLLENQARYIDRFVLNADRLPVELSGVRQGISDAIPELLRLRGQAGTGAIPEQANILNELFNGLDWLYDNFGNDIAARAVTNDSQYSSLSRLIGLSLDKSKTSPARIRKMLADYVGMADNEATGIISVFKAEERNLLDYWHQAVLESGTVLSRKELLSYEMLISAGKRELGLTTRTQPTLALGDVNDRSIIGRRVFGNTKAQQQAAIDAYGGVPATQEVLSRIGIRPSERFNVSAEKVRRAVEANTITRQEACQALVSAHFNSIRSQDVRRLNKLRGAAEYLQETNGSPAQVFNNDPVQLDTGPIWRVIEAEAAGSPDGYIRQFQATLGYIRENVDARIGGLAPAEATVAIRKLYELGRTYNTGLATADKTLTGLRELAQGLGLKATPAGYVAQRVNQAGDSALLHISAGITEATDFIQRVAKTYKLDLNDYDVAEPLLRALYDGTDLPATIGEGHKLVYDLFKQLIDFRQDIIKSGISRLLRYTTKDAPEWYAKTAQFERRFFINDWFPIRWKSSERIDVPLDELGDPILDDFSGQAVLDPIRLAREQNTIPRPGLARRRPTEQTPSNVEIQFQPGKLIGRQPSSFRARLENLRGKTFDEVRELGFEPERTNILDLFRDNTLETTHTLHTAIYTQELIQQGVLIPVRRGELINGKLSEEAVRKYLSKGGTLRKIVGQSTLGDSIYAETAARLEAIPVRQNSSFLRNVLDRAGYTTDQIDEIAPVFQEFVATPQVAALVKTHLNIFETGRFTTALANASRSLKLLKLVGTLFQVVDYVVYRGPAAYFHISRRNGYGVKAVLNYPRFVGQSLADIVSPRRRALLRAEYTGERVRTLVELPNGETIALHETARYGGLGFNAVPQDRLLPGVLFDASVSKLERYGNVSEGISRQIGLKHPVGTTIEAGQRFVNILNKSIGAYNRGVFEGPASRLQVAFLETYGQGLAESLYRQGFTKVQITQTLAEHARLFASTQTAWSSVYQ